MWTRGGRVTGLELSGAGLIGEIPPELGDLDLLRNLDLGQNQLSGEIPRELGNLASLQYLILSNNQLSGEIPPEVFDLPNLEGFHVWESNRFFEVDREALVALYNATNGPGWSRNSGWLSDLPLYRWDGVSTDIRGRVRELNLGRKQLAGQLPPELGDLTYLTKLNLEWNQLSGAYLPSWASWSI